MKMKKFDAKKVLKKYKGGGGVHHPVKVTPQDLLKKKKEGGEIKKYRGELKSEIKGMGPEGKAYLRDELSDKKYEGKLKGKYKEDLDKELYGMHTKGKDYLKHLVERTLKKGDKAKKAVEREKKEGTWKPIKTKPVPAKTHDHKKLEKEYQKRKKKPFRSWLKRVEAQKTADERPKTKKKPKIKKKVLVCDTKGVKAYAVWYENE